MNTLGERIAAALTSDIASTELMTLIADVETAFEEAAASIADERERALDPLAILDPNEARGAIENAEFARDRLRNALLPLRQKLVDVQGAEQRAQWSLEYQAMKIKRDECAAQLASVYPRLIGELVDLLDSAATVDAEVAQVNSASPDDRRLAPVELHARNLQSFDRNQPSIVKELRLPAWGTSSRMVWPPPRTMDTSLFAPIPFDRRSSGEWWQDVDARNEQRRAESALVAAYYEDRTRVRGAS
jgi:hypothetical protein